MEPTTYGIVSIVPVIVLIVVALITKRTFESLLIATLLALILGYKGDWFYALIEQIQTVSADQWSYLPYEKVPHSFLHEFKNYIVTVEMNIYCGILGTHIWAASLSI